jgi:hypothetical protein
VFPEVESPSLVPEEIDEAAPLPVAATEVIEITAQTTMIERVTVSEHFLTVEYVPARPPPRCAHPRGRVFEAA